MRDVTKFHKDYLMELDRDNTQGDAWLCIYYAELYLTQCYIKL